MVSLYHQDEMAWLEEQITALRERNYALFDWDNLIEELEDLGNEKRNKVESLIERILVHLLCHEYIGGLSKNHWLAEIIAFNAQLKRSLTTTLENHAKSVLSDRYQTARLIAFKKYGYPNFPIDCPWQWEQIRDIDWLL